MPALINKVRPLVSDGGTLVTINNALFVSGAAYMAMLETLCADGYLTIEELIPVPQDFLGYSEAASSPARRPCAVQPFHQDCRPARPPQRRGVRIKNPSRSFLAPSPAREGLRGVIFRRKALPLDKR